MERYALLSRISHLLDTLDTNKTLMVSIFHLELNQLIYFNPSFENMLGYKIDLLQKQGWDFWFKNICPEAHLKVRGKISEFLRMPDHQKSLLLQYQFLSGTERYISVRHEMVLHKNNGTAFLINYLFDVSEKMLIEKCLQDSDGNEDIAPNGTHLISERELEVLKLIADGYSSKQIAIRLFISNHTVTSHRKNLIEKFKVKNTAQLIKRASSIMDL